MSASDQQVHLLSTFVQLEKAAREAPDKASFAFNVCNQTKQLIQYHQAVFVTLNQDKKPKIEAISATASINHDAPYVVFLREITSALAASDMQGQINKENLPESIQNAWHEWLPACVYWLPLKSTHDDSVTAGILFTREEPWLKAEDSIIQELIGAYAHAWYSLTTEKSVRKSAKKLNITKQKILIACGVLLLVMLIPVRQSVIADAEIAASEPVVVSSPLDGVIEKLYVKPNQQVKREQVLFGLDPILIQNQFEQAEKALKVAKEKLRKANQHAFYNEESKSQLAILRAELAKSEVEYRYARDLFKRIKVKSPQEGIAIYNDPKDWIGKPVKTGERVMMIANPNKKELDIWLAVGDAINLEPGSKVKLFLNIDPLTPINATLRYASYTASQTADNILAYHIKADFAPDQKIPRIGLQGTAKLYGGRVTLFYYLFWRPISFVRQTLGV